MVTSGLGNRTSSILQALAEEFCVVFFSLPANDSLPKASLSSPRIPLALSTFQDSAEVSVVFTPWWFLFIDFCFRSDPNHMIEYPSISKGLSWWLRWQKICISESQHLFYSYICRCLVAVYRSWDPEYPTDIDKCSPPGLQSEASLWVPLAQGGCLSSHPHGACRYLHQQNRRIPYSLPPRELAELQAGSSYRRPIQWDNRSSGEVTKLIPLVEALGELMKKPGVGTNGEQNLSACLCHNCGEEVHWLWGQRLPYLNSG